MTTHIVTTAIGSGLEERLTAALDGNLERVDLQVVDHQHILEELEARPVELVLIGPELPLDEAVGLAEKLDAARPDVSVLLVTARSTQALEKALRAGVRDLVPPEATAEELLTALERALEASRRRRGALAAEVEGRRSTRVITVVSPKGGAGKTVVASNLAVGLARHARGQVVLVDLDLQFGDVANALLLVPDQTIAQAAQTLRALDTTTLKVYLASHGSGLYVLPAPHSPAEGEQITPEQVQQILGLLVSEFRYVVVDTSAGLTEHTLAALDLSTDLLLVSDMDVASVRSLRKAVDALDRVGITAARRHFILNRADSRVGLEAEDIAATVGMTVDVEIPSSRLVPLSFNQGAPLLDSDPRSPVARSLERIASRFVEVPTSRSSGLFFWRSS